MKTLATLSFFAALVAFVVVQFSFQVSVSMIFAAGLLGLTVSDYTGTLRPLRVPASVPASRAERLGLAA